MTTRNIDRCFAFGKALRYYNYKSDIKLKAQHVWCLLAVCRGYNRFMTIKEHLWRFNHAQSDNQLSDMLSYLVDLGLIIKEGGMYLISGAGGAVLIGLDERIKITRKDR